MEQTGVAFPRCLELRCVENVSLVFVKSIHVQVEHGCAVATISGSRGVVVVGGATGDDVVEFLDWEIRKTWRTLGAGSYFH